MSRPDINLEDFKTLAHGWADKRKGKAEGGWILCGRFVGLLKVLGDPAVARVIHIREVVGQDLLLDSECPEAVTTTQNKSAMSVSEWAAKNARSAGCLAGADGDPS